MLKRRIAFIHTSPAALEPLKHFYTEAAPEMELTNLLDDGILRLFAAKNYGVAERRLIEMTKAARAAYDAELIMVTCSSVPKATLDELRRTSDVPVLKVDEPMAHRAVRAGAKIGVLATFPPTIEPTSNLLKDTAARLNTNIDIQTHVLPQAYDALLAGDFETHDAHLLKAIDHLVNQHVDVVVLAQVSMARIIKRLDGKFDVPVLSSLHTSLTAIREALDGKQKEKDAASV